jgi:hypothetical protein
MSEIVARNGPAFDIGAAGTVRGQAPDFPGLDPNDPFHEFFRRFRIPRRRGERQVRGQGSGFIVRDASLFPHEWRRERGRLARNASRGLAYRRIFHRRARKPNFDSNRVRF